MIHFLQLLLLLSGYPSPVRPLPPQLITIMPPKLITIMPPQLITIKGIVLDSATSTPIGLVTLTLSDSTTGETVRTSATKNDGAFELSAPANHAYKLVITYIGYGPKTILIPATAQSATHSAPGPGNATTAQSATRSATRTIDLGKILLSGGSSGQLQAVAIIASRPVVRQEIDRISYDVQADPDSKANDALEMLRKVPMVTVDANDVVQLKGSGNFQIFINGKPSALMVASPSDVLKAMPAATIQRIEVITVPPSKFDGEGLAGIINIITLKSTTDGINGSLFARYNSVFGERGSASVNVSEGRFSLTGLLGLGRQPMITNNMGSQLTTYSPASLLSQEGQKSDGGHFNNGKVDMGYELDSSNLLTASADFFNRRFNQVTSTYSALTYAPDSLAESYKLRNTGPVTVGALDLGAGDQLKFGRSKDGTLNLSYRYASTSNGQGNTVIPSDGYNYSGSAYTQSNSLKTKAHNIELNLVQPEGKWIIEAGGKAILGTNDSYFSDQTAVNDFSYHQNVFSVYNSYQLKLPGWEVKAGLRLENTAINSSFTQAQTPIHENYLNVLPALSIQRNLTSNSSFTLGYTQRIQRALATQLNPFIDKSDPSFIVTGNPALRPVVNNIVQLDYSRSARLSVNLNVDYTFANNPIQNVTELISDTVSESTYENVGKNQTAGAHLTLNYPLLTKLNLILNTQLSHVWITGTYNSQFYKNDGNQGNAAASARYSFAHQLTASVSFNCKSGNVYLQGTSSSYTYLGFNVIKEFLKRRATISITAFSPWSKFSQYSTSTITPDFSQYTYGQFYNRNFRFAFNYKFGHLNSNNKESQPQE